MRLSIPQIRFVVHTVEFSNYLPRARNVLSSAHSGAGPQLTPWCNRCTSKPGNEADMCVDSIRVSKLEWDGFERLTVQWVRSQLDGHSQRCGHSSMSRWTCNHRAVQVGCDLCRTSAPAFLLKQGHTEEDSQDHLQMLYEVGRLYNPFWHPVPVLQQLRSPELLPNVQMEPPLLQFVLYCVFLYWHWNELGFNLIVHTLIMSKNTSVKDFDIIVCNVYRHYYL